MTGGKRRHILRFQIPYQSCVQQTRKAKAKRVFSFPPRDFPMIKALFQKIASRFKSEAAVVEQDAKAVEATVLADINTIKTQIAVDGRAFIAGIASPISTIEANMSTPAVAPAAPATTNVDSAIKIALFLKALDANLTDAAVQGATNAALAAAYPPA